MPLHTLQWQSIGWNGLSFCLPSAWYPAVILKSSLFFEQQGSPAFAVRWQHVQGRFSPERVIKRLHKSLKHADLRLSEWAIDRQTRDILPSFSMTGFQWQGAGEHGRGILLFCRDCRKATLMQLYGPEQEAREAFKPILLSFEDHNTGTEQLWSIYDIRAMLPAETRLRSHEFMVGRFTLTFDWNKTAITLYRFKPAAALLAGRTLAEFGQGYTDGAAGPIDEECKVTWSTNRRGIAKLTSRLQRKPAWVWLQFRHIPEKNVILGVKGTARHPEEKILSSVAANFTAL